MLERSVAATPRVLADSATPSRRSRTKTALLAGGLTANAAAQAILIACRVFGYEPPVTEVELATLVSMVVALVALWYQREATARAEIEARYARVEASGGRSMSGLLALLIVFAAGPLVLAGCAAGGTGDAESEAPSYSTRCAIELQAAEDERVVRLDLKEGEHALVEAYADLVLEVRVVGPYDPVEGEQVLPDGTPVPPRFTPLPPEAL
jgi:hypothetical protein